MVLYDDEYIQVLSRNGRSSFLLVTFGDLETMANGSSYWGSRLSDTFDLSCLGVVCKSQNWFPQASMRLAANAMLPYRRQFTQSIHYGLSMGAYAALKYSALLHASTVLALSPQTTIDPTTLAHPTPWSKHFNPSLHSSMSIRTIDIGCQCFVIYDPFHPIDNEQAQLISSCSSLVNAIRVPFAGHNPASLIANSAIAGSLLNASLMGDLKTIVDVLKTQKRKAAHRYGVGRFNVMAMRAGAARSRWKCASLIACAASRHIASSQFHNLLRIYSALNPDAKIMQKAIGYLDEINAMDMHALHAAAVALQEERPQVALRLAYHAFAIDPDSVHNARLLVSLLKRCGHPKEEARIAKELMALEKSS